MQFAPSTINFQDDASGVATAIVNVPYTGRNTKLKINVQAVSEECKGRDEGSSVFWSPMPYQKEYIEEIGNEASNKNKDIEFSILSANGSVTKKYRISLKRGQSQEVTVAFMQELLTLDSTAKAEVTWDYGKKEVLFRNGSTSSDNKITVAKDANVNFKITLGDEMRVKDCISTFGTHSLSASGELSIVATGNFTLTITLKPRIDCAMERLS